MLPESVREGSRGSINTKQGESHFLDELWAETVLLMPIALKQRISILFVSLLFGPFSALAAYECAGIIDALHRIATPIELSPKKDLKEIETSLIHEKQIVIRHYTTKLSGFGDRIRATRQRLGYGPIKTVLVPMSGFKMNLLALFPEADVFVFVDRLYPFVARDWLFSKVFSDASHEKIPVSTTDVIRWIKWEDENSVNVGYLSEKGFLRRLHTLGAETFLRNIVYGLGELTDVEMAAFKKELLRHMIGRLKSYFGGATIERILVFPENLSQHHSDPFVCHGVMDFKTQRRGKTKRIIYLHSEIVLDGPPIDDGGWFHRGPVNGSVRRFFEPNRFPPIDAMVVRGTQGLLLSGIARKDSAIQHLLSILKQNHGVLVEGFLGGTGEVFGDPISQAVNTEHNIRFAIRDRTIHFSYTNGIRAVFFQ